MFRPPMVVIFTVTIQAELVTHRMNTQFNTNNNFISILYSNIDIKHLRKTLRLIFVDCFDLLRNISFKEQTPEDGHNRLPKYVGGYAYYNMINLYICFCTCCLFNIRRHSLIWLYLSLGPLRLKLL